LEDDGGWHKKSVTRMNCNLQNHAFVIAAIMKRLEIASNVNAAAAIWNTPSFSVLVLVWQNDTLPFALKHFIDNYHFRTRFSSLLLDIIEPTVSWNLFVQN
jgi:hypothetical protein